jgi:hypothetical protein
MEYYQLTIPVPKKPWLWFRYRIVTFLLLIAIVAILLSWRRDHSQLVERIRQIQSPRGSYCANQVIGPPNTAGPGDLSTAWASAEQDNQDEWLIVEYDTKVSPKAIVIHETYNPGAVAKVTHYPTWGRERVMWQGTDPTPVSAGAGVSRLPVNTTLKTNRIKVYIDSMAVPGWNEIDAVGLECSDGKIVWAKNVEASSNYGNHNYPGFSSLNLQY